MRRNARLHPRGFLSASLACVAALGVLTLLSPVPDALAQQTGAISGRVADEQGNAISGAEVVIEAIRKGALTNASGNYVIADVPAGTHTVRVRFIGYRPQTAEVSVSPGGEATQNFTLGIDPLGMEELIVTGTFTPRVKLESSVAVSTLTPADLERASPRSATEMLRYVPGFTRVESSGGEVNQNYSMRGILGVEYVMFFEDGIPVFPTMHTFWMNADNLFRPDQNLERIEVVRGGGSSLFGSNTPGAIVNLINKRGGPDLTGSMKATTGTDDSGFALARYDFNVNGPLGEDMRFNLGGFYRYDNGIRDPGFPGVRGGQMKASVTRLLDRGSITLSLKVLDDRNQFVLPLPHVNPDDPEYVAGFSDYGAMNTQEVNHVRVPIPTGELEYPLDDGLRTRGHWLTVDAQLELPNAWTVRNSAQIMEVDHAFNAVFPGRPDSAQTWVAGQIQRLRDAGFTLPVTPQWELLYTNHFDAMGDRLPFNTANSLVSPSELPHVEKPISAFQNQLRVTKVFERVNLSGGLYFGHYTQGNRWFIGNILMDVRDNPRLLDLIVLDAAGDTIEVTQGGFRNYLENYTAGSGHATLFSGTLGLEIQATDRVRIDLGGRWESNSFVQTAANTARRDIDGDSRTLYDNELWENGSFRHLSESMDDWAASVGVNVRLTEQASFYAQAGRAFKMPALDEFLNAQPAQAALFDARETQMIEGGLKYASRSYGGTINLFFGKLKNIVGQGLVADPLTGGTIWVITTSPENRTRGIEVEGFASFNGLRLNGNGTFLKADLGSGADIGSWLNLVPPAIANVAATYGVPQTQLSLKGDWHFVAARFAAQERESSVKLPSYSYFNVGASYAIQEAGIEVAAEVLNAFQSQGLEEGDPRAALLTGGSGVFNARPVLPRRFELSLRYDF